MEDKLLRQLNFADAMIPMPKSLIIGDPSYFEEGGSAKKYTFKKTFTNCSDWIAYIKLCEDEYESDFQGKTFTFNHLYLNLYLAPNEKFLNVYKEGNIFSSQSVNTTEIGVDTAEYLLGSGRRVETIQTLSDGFFGVVQSINFNRKLTGLIVDLGLGENNFEDMKKTLEWIFNFKFEE